MKKILFTLIFSTIAFSLFAQTFVETNPTDVGMDPLRLERIDNIVNTSIENGEIPGAVVLIARNGEIAYHKSFGYSDIETKKPIDVNSIFRIASMSKAITTVGVMILYEKGMFKLSDPVSNYLPEFKNPSVLVEADSLGNVLKTEPAKREIRIIDLLTHSSGITYSFIRNKLQQTYVKEGIIDGVTEKEVKLEEIMKKLATLPLLFSPGEDFHYSLSVDLLGYLCEVISEKPFDEFLKEEIFDPLKMNDTYFYLPDSKSSRLVTLYSYDKTKGLVKSIGNESSIKIDNVNYPVEGAKTYFSGGGGLSSTAYDYGRFIQMLLNNGKLEGIRLLSRKSVELMRRPRLDRNEDGIPDFGLGFSVVNNMAEYGELTSDGAYSFGGAFYTHYWIDPQENMIGVFMSQVRPIKSDISARVKILSYQALE
ncbi:MAG: serine hydrolase domain-containing protein [Bacteroidota bacterium]